MSNHVGPADPSQIIAPTVAGNQNNLGPLMNVYAPDQNGVYTKVGQFNTSSGKTSFFPTPTGADNNWVPQKYRCDNQGYTTR